MTETAQYPEDWDTRIRPRVMSRANNCCEFCGIAGRSHAYAFKARIGNRNSPPLWLWLNNKTDIKRLRMFHKHTGKVVRVSIGVTPIEPSSIIEKPEINDYIAVCQLCHTNYLAKKLAELDSEIK